MGVSSMRASLEMRDLPEARISEVAFGPRTGLTSHPQYRGNLLALEPLWSANTMGNGYTGM